ncbi:DUF3068 domain-containing protein [Actinomadura craniellae]|nr:DUF3068 domain-containing protein [Actinomadura craniellae]
MRRSIGLVLVGAGGFLLALAPMLRFYVAERVAIAPLNQYQTTRLEDRSATYFDLATFKTVQNATVTAINTLRGDVRAGNERVAVWDSSTEIFDKQRNKRIQIQGYRVAFDRRTSALVNCCGSNVGGDTSVQMSGYALLFPLANVQKRDYTFFDMTTKRPLPMRYDGVDKVQGMTTYRFVQVVPYTRTEGVEYQVPGELLGLGRRSGSHRVDRYAGATVTVWVDPRTGIPVKHWQSILTTVQTPDGKGKLTVAAADLVTVDADQKRNVAYSEDRATQLRLLNSTVPTASVGVGVVMLAGGSIVAALTGRTRTRPGRDRHGRYGSTSDGPRSTIVR